MRQLKSLIFSLLLGFPAMAQFNANEVASWQKQAIEVNILRDIWGIPHISGKTDADAVFGMIYAQCEDDFNRVERNYITNTARQAEAFGDAFVYHDLRMRLFIDTTTAIRLFNESPPWMKKLCQAFADGINFYLYTHPNTKPILIKRFEPWMPLMFSEGSIGGDIESVSLNELKEFYGKERGDLKDEFHDDGLGEPEPRGSNGFAIAPYKTLGGKALLLINPHTSFYFRSELQITSKEGLNAYGAVTWGQFFVYQGFNEHCGWMHTSSAADVIDEYNETIIKKKDSVFYQYGAEKKYIPLEKIEIAVRDSNRIIKKSFVVYHTKHGPVVASRNGKWVSVKLMVEPLRALTQSWTRIKSNNYADFKKSMGLRTNSSNNTVYADDRGNIAYWHGNFMPRRDTTFNWNLPVDGSNPATEWKGLHDLDQIIQILNPRCGWIQNCNSTPFTATAAADHILDRKKYPAYMAPDFENARGIHAIKVLSAEPAFTPMKLIAAAYDSWLPAFEKLQPSLMAAFDSQHPENLDGPFVYLRDWDRRFSETSVGTTLAIFWAQKLRQNVLTQMPMGLDQLGVINFLATKTTPAQRIEALRQAVGELEQDFGTWKKPWGEINRFQRLTGAVESVFDDDSASLAVPFTSAFWGSLAAYGARRYPNTKKIYGSVGNSFVAVVEFGDKVQAKSIVTGGSSSDPASEHFFDQAGNYCKGKFKNVLFYKEDQLKQMEVQYHPGKP